MRHWLLSFCIFFSPPIFPWNALGHRLIAQIAYDEITPHTRQVLNRYQLALDKIYKPQTLVDSAVWLDMLRYQGIGWYAPMHYIDIPFSEDGSPLPIPQQINAVWAIDNANNVLLNKYATDFDKGIALRILLHVVGDIHQPLHAATKVSAHFQRGDQGGNLVPLTGNPVAKNLHAYWDRGAGLLKTKKRLNASDTREMAQILEKKWPCSKEDLRFNARLWAEESHQLAVNHAYKFPIDSNYQQNTQTIIAHRIALAGCRLANLLTQLDLALTNHLSTLKIS